MTELVRPGAAALDSSAGPGPGPAPEVAADGGPRRVRLRRRSTRPGRSRRARRADRATPYLLLAPAALVLGLVLGYPLVRLVLLSFQDYGLRALFTGKVTWAGWANYNSILDDPQLVPVLLRTVGFCA